MFKESHHVRTLTDTVNKRLGFSSGGTERIRFKDVELIYDICRFEHAWHPDQPSYWCAAFSEDDLKVTISYLCSCDQVNVI